MNINIFYEPIMGFLTKFKSVRILLGFIAIFVTIPLIIYLISNSLSELSGTTFESEIKKLSDYELIYFNTVLSQIDSETTVEEVKKLLGEPEKSTLNSKYSWWVKTNTDSPSKQRVIIYFSKNRATQLRFDGGPGRFYLVKDLQN